MKDIWQLFGPARCISLRERSDRQSAIEQLAKNTQLEVDFHYAERHQGGGIQGCFESHIKLLEKFADEKWCFILEDDALASKLSRERLLEVLRFANSCKDWDIIYLGCFPDIVNGHQRNISGNMYRVHATQTHAYLASQSFMNFAKHWKFRGIPIDEEYKRMAHCYASLPSLFVQSNSKSDVEQSIVPISTSPFKLALIELVEAYATEIGIPLQQWIAMCVVLYLLLTIHSK